MAAKNYGGVLCGQRNISRPKQWSINAFVYPGSPESSSPKESFLDVVDTGSNSTGISSYCISEPSNPESSLISASAPMSGTLLN